MSGPDEIPQLWRKQYYEVLNCVKGLFIVDHVEFYDDVIDTSAEVHEGNIEVKR